jgi:hypothetical protein
MVRLPSLAKEVQQVNRARSKWSNLLEASLVTAATLLADCLLALGAKQKPAEAAFPEKGAPRSGLGEAHYGNRSAFAYGCHKPRYGNCWWRW